MHWMEECASLLARTRSSPPQFDDMTGPSLLGGTADGIDHPLLVLTLRQCLGRHVCGLVQEAFQALIKHGVRRRRQKFKPGAVEVSIS